MTTLPNTGTVLPVRGAPGSGQWGTAIDTALSNYDEHDHSSGRGKRINTDAIAIDADLTFASLYAPTNLHRATFAAITALAAGARAIFVDTSGDLYYRNASGVNIRVTNGSSLNVAAFVGGIGGDYTSVGALVSFDDANDRYKFLQNSATGWARLASGEVRILETGTSETVYVGLAAPAGLAASYTITLPLAAPGSDALLQLSSAGVMSASNTIANAVTLSALVTANAGVTCGANQHVTVSGRGDLKHGDRELTISAVHAVVSNAATTPIYGVTPVSVSATGGGGFFWSLPMRIGDRIKSVTVSRKGDGAADLTNLELLKTSAAGVDTSLGTTSATNPSASWADTQIDVSGVASATRTLSSGETFTLVAVTNASNLLLGNVRVIYDHP